MAPALIGGRNHKPPTTNHTSGFTLIEILVVIMLLTVLMLTAFPAFRGLERTTNRHRATAEADALAQAALAYRRTYGQWPLEPRENGEATVFGPGETAIVAAAGKDRDGPDISPNHLDLAKVADVMRNIRRTGTEEQNDHNPRRMIFLDLPDECFDDDGTPLDPWRQPYVLVMSRVSGDDKVARHEGGVRLYVESSQRASEPAEIDAPEDAVAFSWGDPAIPETQDRILGSWSKR